MTSTKIENVTMIMETAVVVMCKFNFALTALATRLFVSNHLLDTVGSSRILIGKQKIGLTFNSDKLGGNDFTKFSKLTMCSAGASRCWLVQWPGLPPRHCTWSVLKFL